MHQSLAQKLAHSSWKHAGGKTASLKTMGLMALMAKAGMYLPIVPSPSSQQNTSADSNGATLEHAPAGPRLQWFDSVLADVGDSQDLQQSLSTFSGHVRRLSRILAAAGSSSLVLLDEVRPLQHAGPPRRSLLPSPQCKRA